MPNWTRIETGRYRHRKMDRLAKILGVPRMYAVGLHDTLLALTTEAGRTDGSLESISNEDIARATGFKRGGDRLMSAFVQAGLVDDREGHLFVHDYFERASSSKDLEKKKQQDAKRAKEYRERQSEDQAPSRDASRSTNERTNERTNVYSAEVAPSAPPRTTPPVTPPTEPAPEDVAMEFPVSDNGGKLWPLTKFKVAEYQGSFPGVDILREARAARQWCIDNPTKRKTPRGINNFLRRWFDRAQNSGLRQGVPSRPPQAAPPPGVNYLEIAKAEAARELEFKDKPPPKLPPLDLSRGDS